jgi:hypothetical protein
MDGEKLLFDAQSRTHFCEGARNQLKPPLFIAHCPKYFAVALYPPPIVHMRAELNLFLSIRFGQSGTNALGIHAEIRLRFKPVEDRLG